MVGIRPEVLDSPRLAVSRISGSVGILTLLKGIDVFDSEGGSSIIDFTSLTITGSTGEPILVGVDADSVGIPTEEILKLARVPLPAHVAS